MSAARELLLAGALLFAFAGTPTAAGAATQPSVKDSPGYVAPSDPDSAAERLGRRTNAPAVSVPFTGGAKSVKALGEAILGAFHAERADSLLQLCVTMNEFRDILWPEFPQSRPATGLRWDDAWPVLYGRLNGGSLAAVREFGGHHYTLVRVEVAAVVPYRNFKLHNRVAIVARDDTGREVRFTGVRSIAERRGRFKLYSLFD